MNEEEEKPDARYFLPEGERILTAEREAKGDMLVERRAPTRLQREMNEPGTVYFAQAVENSILNFLSHTPTIRAWCIGNQLPPYKAILEPQHAHDGRTYELWQTLFHARQGYRNNPLYSPELAELRTAVKEDGYDPSDFVTVIRTLTLEQKKVIEFSLYTQATDRLRHSCLQHGLVYQKAFDRLCEIMEPMREEARRRREAKNNY